MCGVGGYVLRRPITHAAPLVEPLLAGLRHRGPNDEGIALVARRDGAISSYRTLHTARSLRERLAPLHPEGTTCEHDVALVHTRYSIIDLSDRAHQPFLSHDGTLVASYNGEVYNFRELADELRAQGVVFRSASDTEILVEGYHAWGDDVWRRLNGFWAIVLYDARRRSVVVSRDRMGVAPLYFRETPDGIFFSSAIRPLHGVAPDGHAINREVVRGFVDYGLKDYDDGTCYRDIRSFPPAAALRFAPDTCRVADAERITFWRFPTTRWTSRDLSLDEAATRLRTTLFRAVELRLRADVPVAFELSGGLDSSSIVAAAAALRQEPVATFTVSVPERDEEPFARSLRDRYALRYHVLAGQEERFGEEGARFAETMEEPYHSPNVFTAWQMRRAMKASGVAVAVSGSGGDEVLAGYEYDFWNAAARELRKGGRRWHALRHSLAMHFGSAARARLTIEEAIGRMKDAAGLGPRGVASPAAPSARAARHADRYRALSFQERSIFHFEIAQLPYYLRSNDHLTMSIPLETRFPFLDFEMVELGLQLPVEYLFCDGWSKYVLRRAMHPLLPASIVWRREKMGFPFPLRAFLAHHRDAFASACQRVVDAGLLGGAPPDWNALAALDPVRLWRLVSTGMWLAAAQPHRKP